MTIGVDLLKLATNHPDRSLTFDSSSFIKLLRRYNDNTLPKVLMDQSVVSGIGNYVKAEVLYKSKVSPHVKIKDLADTMLECIYLNTLDILRRSYVAGGVSVRNYEDLNNVKGNFVRLVYNKSEDPYGNKVITEITDDKRTTHWVPTIQNKTN